MLHERLRDVELHDTSVRKVPSFKRLISREILLPHHAVWKQTNEGPKIRVVLNASARTSSEISHNDVLLTEPKLQANLTAVILRWRQFKIIFTADMIKMYRQIRVHQDDQPLQRIIWRPPEGQEPQTYQLTTVTYGTAYAPFLAFRTLKQLARDEEKSY